MLRRLAIAALLTTVAAAPVARVPGVSAQAPDMHKTDAGTFRAEERRIGGSAASLHASPSVRTDLPAPVVPPPALPPPPPDLLPPPLVLPPPPVDEAGSHFGLQVSEPESADPGTPTPELASEASRQANASETQPTQKVAAEALARLTPDRQTAASSPPPADGAEAETADNLGETLAARDLGAWVPSLPVPLNEPVADRQTAAPAPEQPVFAAVVPAPTAPVEMPPAASASESEPETEVIRPAATVARAAPVVPVVRSAPLRAPLPVTTGPPAASFVAPASPAATPALSLTAPPAVSGEPPAASEAAPIDPPAAAAATPTAGALLPPAAPAPVVAIAIPTTASFDGADGPNLPLFAALFAALGTVAVGFHFVLRRIESTL